MWELFRHLNTQLPSAICRLINTDEVLLFDGQHKSAAQIWAGQADNYIVRKIWRLAHFKSFSLQAVLKLGDYRS